jgi:hypothetical protein
MYKHTWHDSNCEKSNPHFHNVVPLDMLVLTLALLLSVFIFQANSAFAAERGANPGIPQSGYCDDPSPHCWAEISWENSFGGASTSIQPSSDGYLNCEGCGSGFITDEMWFYDNASSQCLNTQYGQCWVEAGISTWPTNDQHSCDPGHDSICVFWADNRPYGGGYTE